MEGQTQTIAETRRSLAQGAVSVPNLITESLHHIKERNKELNAYLEVFEEDAFREAEVAEEKIRQGVVGPLMGIPFAVKDNILVEGRRASAASRMLENYAAPYTATAIRKLRDAGAIILGRTNMDEFAMGSSTENSAFGPTKNPYDTARVPGGSSGGSTAAVAAHMCLAALGSDTGGSIRQPASFCGVVGLKPTYGTVSRHGLIAMASSLDVIGPITQTVEDAEIIYNVIKGKDPLDSTALEARSWNLESRKEKMRIGVPKEYFGVGLDSEVKQIIENALKKLETRNYKLETISLPHADYALACYYIIMPAEVSSNLSRYDGMRYGLSKEADDLLGIYTKTRREGFGDEVRRRILLGAYVLSAGYYDAYYAKAQSVRSLIKQDFQKAFQNVDIIVSPTTPTPAFRFGEKSQDPVEMYLSDIYTVSANLAGIPALSVPCGVSKNGLPIGIQFMGRWFEEDMLFVIGKRWEQLRDS